MQLSLYESLERKLKPLFLELADDFEENRTKKGLKMPFRKRWRIWCGSVFLGVITKKKVGKDWKFEVATSLNMVRYSKDWNRQGDKMVYDRSSRPQPYPQFDSLKEAQRAFKQEIINDLKMILE